MMNVTIIQRRLTHYRVDLFEGLKARLAQDGIRLRLLHGEARSWEKSKKDEGTLSWASPLATHYLISERLCWQPFAAKVLGDDLVIMTQENAMLANHLALLKRPAKRLAFWGHGANLQGDSRSLRERFKTWSTNRVDWYFAYTQMSVNLVTRAGFPAERITRLDNSVNLAEIRRNMEDVTVEDMESLRSRLGLGAGPVGLSLGSLYKHKRLDFLIDSSELIRKQVPEFQLVVVGAGPEQAYIKTACAANNWIHYLGPLHGRDKAIILRMADVLLNPGLVGLGILDSFIAKTPMLTTDCGLHSPEIAYLKADNGVITSDDRLSYATACIELLKDSPRLEALKEGCQRAAERYTLPNMIERFAIGIQAALEVPPL